MPKTKFKNVIFIVLVIIFITALYSYSQFLKKSLISVALQYQIDLQNPPENIYAISIFDQKLPDGRNIPKGTRFIGTISKENNNIIYFNTIQFSNNKKEKFIGRTTINTKEEGQAGGVSAKIGKTLYQQTKTNVLGAIFYNSSSREQNFSGQTLQKGSVLKIETE